MADEKKGLAVKVKVTLDTSQKALGEQLNKLQASINAATPIVVPIKVDKSSLQNSIKEAFGDDAVDSLTKKSKNKVREISAAYQKLYENMKELHSWEKRLKAEESAEKPNTKAITAINAAIKECKRNIDSAETKLLKLKQNFNKNEKYLSVKAKYDRDEKVTSKKAEGVTEARSEEEAIKNQAAAINDLCDALDRQTAAWKKLNQAKATGNKDNIALYDTEYKDSVAGITSAKTDATKAFGNDDWQKNEQYLSSVNKRKTEMLDSTNKLNAALKTQSEKVSDLNVKLKDAETSYSKIDNKSDGLIDSYKKLSKIMGDDSLGDVDKIKKFNEELKRFNSLIRESSAENTKSIKNDAEFTGLKNLYSQILEFTRKNKRVLLDSELGDSFKTLIKDAKDGTKSTRELRREFSDLRAQAIEAGLATETLGEKIEKLWSEHIKTAMVMAGIHFIQNGLRQVYTNVVEIDTAMTELKKVTNETNESYERFLDNAGVRAKEIGATITDVVNATADFARLGYDLNDATTLADSALIYKNVGDGISDINEAASSLISTMQAFGIAAKDTMTIVDEFNAAGNNFAISSAGVGQALQRSGAALASANNTMEESIALATAMNRVIQNPDQVGTTLKTVSMYLRATKTDLEATGESADGMAETTSKLRESLKALSHGQVDIFDTVKQQYKSTTQIIIDMGKAWSVMSDQEQAAALELMGGKRNANALSSLIENWEEIEKVIDTVKKSSGSAAEENEKYLNSIQGKLAQLNSSFQKLSNDTLDSNFVKFFVSAAEAVTDTADGLVNLTGILPLLAGGISGILSVGGPKTTGFTLCPPILLW